MHTLLASPSTGSLRAPGQDSRFREKGIHRLNDSGDTDGQEGQRRPSESLACFSAVKGGGAGPGGEGHSILPSLALAGGRGRGTAHVISMKCPTEAARGRVGARDRGVKADGNTLPTGVMSNSGIRQKGWLHNIMNVLNATEL